MDTYLILHTFRSPAINCKPNQPLKFKTFNEGETVNGYIRNSDGSGFKLTPQIVVENKWAIPLDKVTKIDANTDTSTEKAANELSNIKKKIMSTDIESASKMLSKGMIFGFLAGAVIAAFTKNSKLLFGITGAVAGSIISKQIHKKSLKSKQTKINKIEKS